MKHISRALVEKMPKTDLHCHFDGSIRLSTLIELAQLRKIDWPSYEPQVLMEKLKYGRVRKNLEEYLEGFVPLVAVLQEPKDIERAFFEVCEDAAFENVWHLELRYCPYLHTQKGLSSKQVIECCTRAAKRAERELSMSVGQILCGLKHNDRESILEVAKLAAEFRSKGVVGFDMAGPEVGYPIRDHLEAIYFAKKHHLFITLHAGENYGPESIAQAIHEAGAHRIGHGTSLIHDPELLDYVRNHRIGVESCPVSNWHTGSIKSLDEHPIKQFLEAGVRVSINTDNRLCSDTTITEEIMAVSEHLNLNLEQIKRLLTNGFKSAFLPYHKRAQLLRAFNQYWETLVNKNT
jgi:adenosine deaminase